MTWKNLKDYYVYTYYNESGIPYYVGMGKGNRVVKKHLYVEVPVFDRIKIIDGLTQEDAWNKEIELIAYFGREDLGKGPLQNLTNGGPTQKSGWNQSKQAKEKISKGNTGKIRTLEHRQHYTGKKTVEHAENIRKSVKKLWADPEYREQRIAKIKEKPFAHKGKPWSTARREAHMNKNSNKGKVI